MAILFSKMVMTPNCFKIFYIYSVQISILGPTPLHLAARCGALDAISCMLAINAQPTITDHDGWLPIHHAAYFDHEAVIRLFTRKDQNMIEFPTRNE
jgi:hypothetical protein